jgi:hypothetical protein
MFQTINPKLLAADWKLAVGSGRLHDVNRKRLVVIRNSRI